MMDDNVYNRCLRIATMACDNMKEELARINGMQNPNSIQVKVRDKDQLVEFVQGIMKLGSKGMSVYKSRVQLSLIISSEDMRFKNTQKAGELFVTSVIRSREARVCQKHLIDLQAAEIYLKEAARYDKTHPYKLISESAFEQAKHVVVRKYSSDFMNNFDLNTPCIKDSLVTVLRKQAFDKRYAFGTQDSNNNMARKKYETDYLSRNDFFLRSGQRGGMSEVKSFRDRPFTLASLIIADLYKGAFARLPAKRKIRRFVNLRSRNRDIEICPMRNLSAKRQFATIDAMTMHRYIYDFYADKRPAAATEHDLQIYYFRRELEMYKYMWGESTKVTYERGKLKFGDGTSVDLPPDILPHEGLHRVNAAYGALFGYGSDDITDNWLYNAVRQAYTAEGLAEYRLAMIEARLKGKL